MLTSDLKDTEYNPYYKTYVDKASASLNVVDNLKDNLNYTLDILQSIDDSKYDYHYAEGKWTIKELVQHVIDTERAFAYRALRFSRNETINLLGFDQDDFNRESFANTRRKDELLEDFIATRSATIALFSSFNETMLKRIGMASGSNMSTRATGFIIVGHTRHHLDVLQERYL